VSSAAPVEHHADLDTFLPLAAEDLGEPARQLPFLREERLEIDRLFCSLEIVEDTIPERAVFDQLDVIPLHDGSLREPGDRVDEVLHLRVTGNRQVRPLPSLDAPENDPERDDRQVHEREKPYRYADFPVDHSCSLSSTTSAQ
jgi:hypothetical protein